MPSRAHFITVNYSQLAHVMHGAAKALTDGFGLLSLRYFWCPPPPHKAELWRLFSRNYAAVRPFSSIGLIFFVILLRWG